VKIVVGATFWPKLEAVEFCDWDMGDAGLTTLAGAGKCRLRELDVRANGITAAGVRALAESPLLSTVEHLNLTENPIGNAGVLALVRSKYAKRLRKLDLYSCEFDDAGVKALAESPNLATLRELHISGRSVGLEGAKALAASPHLGALTRLMAYSVTGTARKYLKKRFGKVVSC
jgi:hypothetical protein